MTNTHDLPEKEVDVLSDLVGADKVRLVQHVGVVLDGALKAVLATSCTIKKLSSLWSI